MTSTLENVWSDITDLIEELTPSGRAEPLYRQLTSQKKGPGVSLHRRFWFEYRSMRVDANRGMEMSEALHTFVLRIYFDYQRYSADSFERAIASESTAIWRMIESNDHWGDGVRAVYVEETVREDAPGNELDVIMTITIKAMVDEIGGSLAVNGEVPTGSIDGSNAVFTLSLVPRLSTLLVFKNGLAMRRGLDFTISGQTITFDSTQIPQVDAVLWVKFQS